jgi:2-methylcitrate dehydratase PrpD
MLAPRSLDALLDLAALPASAIPDSARAMARLSLFDGFAVARAGVGEPVAKIVRDLVAEEGGKPAATVVGLATKVPTRAAALANGAIMHALDYDDTHFAHVGHPTVAVLPAALAVAEEIDASGADVLDALLIGAEASVRIGIVLGRAHYERGFHQTATAGAFGATVAAARVLGLSRETTRQALSLVATRASGLKSQFGSMGKPFNAGIAASNGVEAAALAARGFVSCDDGVGGPQGFVDAHVDEAFEDAAWGPQGFLFEDVKHKLHACCHGLHAALEALGAARRAHGLTLENTAELAIRINPRWLKVCDIKQPRTGLEAKFSYAMTAAMTLAGLDTASDRAYSQALCRDARLVGFLDCVSVAGDARESDTSATLRIARRDGFAIEVAHDLAARTPLAALEQGLRAKAAALLGAEAAGRLWETVAGLERISARALTDGLH